MTTHPQFQVKKGKDGWSFFELTSKDKEIILSSENFRSKDDCLLCIESLKKNVHVSENYVAKVGKYGKIYFVIRSLSGEILSRSGLYNSVPELEKGIEMVKKLVPVAQINNRVAEGKN
jgi:uncharacterized protein